MTTHYIDITLRPDPDFSPAHLLSALVSKLHRALVALKASDIGTSYPRHCSRPRTLGDVLRLHGTPDALARLTAEPWLRGMESHVSVSAAAAAPANAPHRVVQRRQFKTNVERLRRRRMRRKGETAEQAAQVIPGSVERQPTLPFVQLRSASSGHSFALFIEHGALQDTPQPGEFNSYGLSQQATVPWF